MPRGHDVVHVPPELLVRVREVTLVILQVQHGVQQTHLLNLLAAVPLRLVHLPPLFHDVVAHLLERIVRVDELLQSPDAKLSPELEQGQRCDEHLAHDLRAPVVRLKHRVLRELAFAGDDGSRFVQQVERVIERDWRDDVEEEVLRVEIHVLHDALPWARLRGRHVERLDQVSHAVLHHGAECLEEVVVYERLLAHFPVLPVVFALRTGDAEVFEDEPEDVGEEPIAVVRRVGLADVLHGPRVDGGHAPGSDRVLDAHGVVSHQPVPLEHRGWHAHRVRDGLLECVEEDFVLEDDDVLGVHRGGGRGGFFFGQRCGRGHEGEVRSVLDAVDGVAHRGEAPVLAEAHRAFPAGRRRIARGIGVRLALALLPGAQGAGFGGEARHGAARAKALGAIARFN